MIKDIESCADSISSSVKKYYTNEVVVKPYANLIYVMAQSKKGVRR